MNKYINAIYNNLIFFVINTLFFIVATPLAIKVMGDEFFGLWSILYAILILSNMGTLGIASIVTKFSAEVQVDDPSREYALSKIICGGALIVLVMSIAAGLVYLGMRSLIAGWLAVAPDWQEQFSNAMIFVALSIPPLFLSKVSQGFLLSQLETRLVRQIDTGTSMVLWLGAILSVKFLGRDLVLTGYWCLFYAGLVFVFYLRALLHRLQLHLVIDRAKIRSMLNFSGFMFLESIAITLFQQVDRVIVGITLGPALAGVYTVGTGLGLRMSMIAGQATEVMIPYASLKDSINDHPRLYAIFCMLSRYISLFVACLGGMLVLWMDEILSLWISPAYASNYSLAFRLFIVGYGLLSLSRPAHQTLTGIGKVKITSLIYSVVTMVMFISLYFLSRQLRLSGAALANFVPALLLVMNLYIYKRMSGRAALMQLFGDLKWGIFLPGLLLILVLFEPVIWLKILMTIALGAFSGIIVYKDEWMQPWLTNQLKRVAN
ncbi:MAG: lipopolysaccharide biosynthesis protein [Chloroflexota bacterium]